MQKLRPIINTSIVNSKFVRNATVSSASVKVTGDAPVTKSWKEIPGPPSLPLVGQLLNFIPGGRLYGMTGTELTSYFYKTYGPIVKIDIKIGMPPLIFLLDAESSAQVLRGENSMPIRPGFKTLEYYRNVHNKTKEQSEMPKGLITDIGERWKSFRSAVNPVLLQPKTIKLYTSAIDEVAKDMIVRMKSLRDENNQIKSHFDEEMNLWALESIGIVALGCRLNCFDPNLAEDSPVRKLIQIVHDLFIVADELDFKPSLWRIFPTPTFKKAMKLYEEQENLTKYFIKQGLEQLEQHSNKSEEEKGVLEKLLDINEEYAYIMASDMLVAGIDTAANTMTAILYLLAINPEKQEKLRQEVLSKQERRPYMRACIKEAMRLMPVVAGNIRLTTREYNILGYKIPKNMHVTFAHQEMSVMEENYVKAKEFIPERWIAEKTDPLYHGNAHPFANSPFGFGVRSCIGRRIAELEIETFLARIMENFLVEWQGPPPRISATSLNYIKGPFNFFFKDL